MLSKLAPTLGLAVVVSLLSGCAITKPSNQQDVCTKMKREWVYHTSNLNNEAAWTTQYQKEQFKQKMRENNCL